MKTTEFVKMGLEVSKQLTLGLIDDMKDAPLTFPTSKGGNHPLWVLGHLAFSECGIVNGMMLGEENPLEEWKDLFGGGSEPVADASKYPPLEEIAAKFEEVRAKTLSILAEMSDEDLDQKSKGCPPEREAFFGTYGQCFLVLSFHSMMHRGQVADARRMLDRKPLVA